MPSPIAHTVSGYVIAKFLEPSSSIRLYKGSKLSVFYIVFVAIAADFDFILQFMTGAKLHRGFTHSLVFALIFSWGLSCLIYYVKKSNYGKIFMLTLAVYCSHLALDFFTQGGSGMLLLWPFSDSFFKSTISLFPGVHHSRGLFDSSHIIFISFELTYALILICGSWWWWTIKRNKLNI